MKIAIIGTGNVGSTLSRAFIKAGHAVLMGAKLPLSEKSLALAREIGAHRFTNVTGAVEQSDIIVIAVPAQFATAIAGELGDVANKVIIDTMNAVGIKPAGFSNTADAVMANCNSADVVKCFNTTGFENLENPVYDGVGIDMFVAGNSAKGKDIAVQLARDMGFANCYDFGGNNNFFALEQLAFAWINLAMLQKYGRGMAFKLIKR